MELLRQIDFGLYYLYILLQKQLQQQRQLQES